MTGYWQLVDWLTGDWRLCSLPWKSISMSDARTARPAPVRNAACGETRVQRSAEQQAGGEAADAERGVVDAERGAARAAGAMSATHAFSAPSVSPKYKPVDKKDGDDDSQRVGEAERGVHDGVKIQPSAIMRRRPKRSDSAPPTIDEVDLDDVQRRPQQRNPERRHAEVAEAQQQERVARIARVRRQDDGRSRGRTDGQALAPRSPDRPGSSQVDRHAVPSTARAALAGSGMRRMNSMTMMPGTIVNANSDRYWPG